MKKLIAAGLFLAFLSGCAGLPGVGGGNPQIQSLEATTSVMVADFGTALDQSATAYVSALSAVDNKTESARIEAETKNLREQDKDKMEASIGMLNEIDLSAELEKSGELSAEGKKKLSKAMLHMGIAIFFDAKIATPAPSVVSDAKGIMQGLSPSDAMSAASVKNIIANASWIADIAPDQLSLLKKNFETLKEYANAHGIEVPSEEEIAQEASGLSRE